MSVQRLLLLSKIVIVSVTPLHGQMDKKFSEIVVAKTKMVPCFVTFLVKLFVPVVMSNVRKLYLIERVISNIIHMRLALLNLEINVTTISLKDMVIVINRT